MGVLSTNCVENINTAKSLQKSRRADEKVPVVFVKLLYLYIYRLMVINIFICYPFIYEAKHTY